MAKDRIIYTPDGDKVTLHDHHWIQVSVTVIPNPDVARPIAGTKVLWRCSRRNCQGLKEVKYTFRKPTVKATANILYGGPLEGFVNLG